MRFVNEEISMFSQGQLYMITDDELAADNTAAQNIIKAPKLEQMAVQPGQIDESYISCSDLDEGGQTAEKDGVQE